MLDTTVLMNVFFFCKIEYDSSTYTYSNITSVDTDDKLVHFLVYYDIGDFLSAIGIKSILSISGTTPSISTSITYEAASYSYFYL